LLQYNTDNETKQLVLHGLALLNTVSKGDHNRWLESALLGSSFDGVSCRKAARVRNSTLHQPHIMLESPSQFFLLLY